ncbi:MAG: hypothetical protein AAF628_19820 [Planctomycetota bacterium]
MRDQGATLNVVLSPPPDTTIDCAPVGTVTEQLGGLPVTLQLTLPRLSGTQLMVISNWSGMLPDTETVTD